MIATLLTNNDDDQEPFSNPERSLAKSSAEAQLLLHAWGLRQHRIGKKTRLSLQPFADDPHSLLAISEVPSAAAEATRLGPETASGSGD